MDRDTAIKDIDRVLQNAHHLRKSRWSDSVFAEIQSLLSACIDRRALKGSSHIREKNYALRKFNSGQMLASHIQQNVADHLEGILRGIRSDWLALPEDHSQNSMIQPEQDYLHRLEILFSNFHRVARHLLSRHSNRPTIEITDEYDVQDLLRALLCLDFADIRSEEWTPSYAGGSARTDFLLKPEKTVIEVKMTRYSLNDRKLGEELLVDIARYQAHPDCQTLICFIYNPLGILANPTGLRTDLENRSTQDFTVLVRISPE